MKGIILSVASNSHVKLVFLDCLLGAVLRGVVVAHSESVVDAIPTMEESMEFLIVIFCNSVTFKSICSISFDQAEEAAFIPVSENV